MSAEAVCRCLYELNCRRLRFPQAFDSRPQRPLHFDVQLVSISNLGREGCQLCARMALLDLIHERKAITAFAECRMCSMVTRLTACAHASIQVASQCRYLRYWRNNRGKLYFGY